MKLAKWTDCSFAFMVIQTSWIITRYDLIGVWLRNAQYCTSAVVIVRFLLYFLFFLIDDRWGEGEG